MEPTGWQPPEEYEEPDTRLRYAVISAAAAVVVVAIVALVLPGVLIGVSTASRTAELACSIVGAAEAPDAAYEARFELTGAEGPGWYCYATAFGGREVQLRFLGFIPEVKVVSTPGVRV